MSYIDHIVEFLFDEHRRLSSKAAVVVFVILAILFVDNLLGFSHSFTTDKKIEQVQKLNTILKDSTTDSTTKAFALGLRTDIIRRQSIVNKTLSLLQGRSNSSIKHQTNNPPTNANPNDVAIKNNFWFHLTAGGLWYLLAALMLPGMILTDKTTSLIQRIATGLLAAALFFGFGWFFYWLCSFIPQIAKTTWVWNYIINFILQALLVIILVAVLQKKK